MKAVKTILAAAMLPLLFSCAKEIPAIEKPAQNPEESSCKFTVVATGEAPDQETQSKASFEDNKLGIVWDSGEKAGIVSEEGKLVPSDALSTSTISNDGFKASFQFTADEGSYRIFYPYNDTSSYGNYKFAVAADQTQNEAGKSSDIFALVGKEDLSLEQNKTVEDFTMNAVGSYIWFRVYGKAGEKVQSIEITSLNGAKLSGSYVAGNDGDIVKVYGTGNSVKVSLDSKYTTTDQKAEAEGIYVAILPGVTSKNQYKVTTDSGIYLFYSDAEKEFKMGTILVLPLNLASDKVAPGELYLIGDATPAGWTLANAISMTTEDGGETYSCETILQAGSAREGFKFLRWNTSWSDVYVNDGEGKLKFYVNPGENDKKFTVENAGNYKITANVKTGELKATPIKEYPEILYQFEKDANQIYKAKYIDVMKPKSGENGVYNAKILVGFGDGYHDFKIRKGDTWYHDSTNYPEVNFNNDGNVDVLSREWSVIGDSNSGLGWWINDLYSEKYYDISLNTQTNKVTVKLSQGKKFYIIGINGKWNDYDSEYLATADDSGIAKWNDLTVTQECDFKIYGENMISGDFYGKGEWYQSQLAVADSQNDAWEWTSGKVDGNTSTPVLFGKSGDYNRKWKFTETGTFTVEFDTKNLTLKVTKTE